MHYSKISAVTLKQSLAVLAIFALVFGPFSKVLVAVANEDHHEERSQYIKVCHAETVGFTPFSALVLLLNGDLQGAHLHHSNDIVPPYTWTDNRHHLVHETGLNWTPNNQIIWNNGLCNGVVPPPPVDMCPNIEGAQATIPEGKMVDNAGNCVDIPPPPVDVCTNLEGVQTEVPTGYTADGSTCTPVVPPTDLCPNIDGAQDVIPEGKQLDNAGNCVDIPPPPVDVCTNLEGVQTEVPSGYIADGSTCTLIPPPVDLCPNIEGTQSSIPEGDVVNSDGQCVAETEQPKACSINVVSDISNTVTENDDSNAVLTWVHPAWLASIPSSAAQWIWGSADVQNPTQTETETFVKKFNWNGPVTAALLKIATDNSYIVKLNGTQVAADPSGDNFTAADSVDVQSNVITGQNTLEISVTNTGVEGSAAHDNPAGLLYNLDITGDTETDCTKVSTDGGGTHPTYELYGFVWNDTNKDDVINEGEDDLSGWTVRAVNASNSEEVYTTTTGTDGRYSLIVPAGTWIISELTASGWVLLTVADGDGTYTVTVPAPAPAPAEVTFMNWLIPTAEAAAAIPSFGPYNFGNNEVATDTPRVNTNGRGHTNYSSPRGEVRGASDSKAPAPTGEVLGAATTTLPVGAPNTGNGGTSPTPTSASSLSAILATRTSRKTK